MNVFAPLRRVGLGCQHPPMQNRINKDRKMDKDPRNAFCDSGFGEFKSTLENLILTMKVTRKRKRLMWLMITSIAFLRLRKRRKAGRCSRRTWVRSIFRHRLERSEMKLVEEMRATNDIESHISYLRMSPRCFDILLQKNTTIYASSTGISKHDQTERFT